MEGAKEYYLKLSERQYNDLTAGEELFLSKLGLEVRQIATEADLKDENYKKIRKQRIEMWNEEQKYLFNKRNK